LWCFQAIPYDLNHPNSTRKSFSVRAASLSTLHDYSRPSHRPKAPMQAPFEKMRAGEELKEKKSERKR